MHRGSDVSLKKKIKKELIGTSDYPSNKIFTISNFITFTRLILTFVFLYLFITNENRYIALIIYAIAASTDWMDGQIARMTKTVSWLGKMMDPIVDRALLFTGVLGLVGRGELPIWVCEEGHIHVIGSRQELREMATTPVGRRLSGILKNSVIPL